MEYSRVPMYTLKAVREKSVKYPRQFCGHPEEAARILRAYLGDKDCEHVVVLMVDGQNAFIGLALVTIGTLHGCTLAARDIFKHALVHRAHGFILGHNHPSGDVNPSQQDRDLTDRVKRLGQEL